MEQVVVIGAGPCGLSAAVELQQAGIEPLIIEKGCIVNSIYHFPTFMQFFSTPELIEIGGVPFPVVGDKPTRHEALTYYRTVASRKQLRIRTYEKVTSVRRTDNHFTIETVDRFDEKQTVYARYVVFATGYYDQPNAMNVPGENLSKVFHYFKEAHPYTGMKTAVIGLKNSAVDAAMELERAGADVTVIYRGSGISDSVKAWVRPVFESTVAKGRIRMLWNSEVKEIRPKTIFVEQEGKLHELENDFVFAMTGYRQNRTMLHAVGVEIDPHTGIPRFDERTMETNVEGLYIAGVMAAGYDANVIFIENGRLHGKAIAEAIREKRKGGGV